MPKTLSSSRGVNSTLEYLSGIVVLRCYITATALLDPARAAPDNLTSALAPRSFSIPAVLDLSWGVDTHMYGGQHCSRASGSSDLRR